MKNVTFPTIIHLFLLLLLGGLLWNLNAARCFLKRPDAETDTQAYWLSSITGLGVSIQNFLLKFWWKNVYINILGKKKFTIFFLILSTKDISQFFILRIFQNVYKFEQTHNWKKKIRTSLNKPVFKLNCHQDSWSNNLSELEHQNLQIGKLFGSPVELSPWTWMGWSFYRWNLIGWQLYRW